MFEEKKVFEKKKKELNQTIDEKVNKELFTKEKIMKNSLIKQIKSENDFILKQKNLELDEKSKRLKNYHMLKAQNEKIKESYLNLFMLQMLNFKLNYLIRLM